MSYEEAKVEFVPIDMEQDMVTESPGSSQYICQGSSPDEDCDDANRF